MTPLSFSASSVGFILVLTLVLAAFGILLPSGLAPRILHSSRRFSIGAKVTLISDPLMTRQTLKKPAKRSLRTLPINRVALTSL